MPGGFIGAGAKTVIPAKAVAKVSMRLVPDMTPGESFAKYKKYVESLTPLGIVLEVRRIHSGDPIVGSTDNEYVKAATEAMREVFGKGDGVCARGRIDSDCGGFRQGAEDADSDDGVRPTR